MNISASSEIDDIFENKKQFSRAMKIAVEAFLIAGTARSEDPLGSVFLPS